MRKCFLFYIIVLFFSTISISYTAPNMIKFYLFSSSDCNECYKIKYNFFPEIENKFNIKLVYKDFDIMEEKNFELLLNIRDYFKKEDAEVPVIVINNIYISGFKNVYEQFPKIVEGYIRNNIKTEFFNLNKINNSSEIISLSFLPVVYAGLLDGINPCAFATIIFLISYLTYLKRSKKTILVTGIFYTLAVFVTYLLIGFGSFEGIKRLPFFHKISMFINLIIAIFAYILAFLSLKDFFLAKKAKFKEMILQLPDSFKIKIHKTIREKTRQGSIIISAILLGFLVSLFELACTGQIYLPTVIYLTRTGELIGFVYLVIYNIMFIIPLIIIFGLFYSGISSEKISKVFQKNISLIKFLTFILFLILGTVLLFYTF